MSTTTDSLLIIAIILLCGMIYMQYYKTSTLPVASIAPTTLPANTLSAENQLLINYIKTGIFNNPIPPNKPAFGDIYIPEDTLKFLNINTVVGPNNYACVIEKIRKLNKNILSLCIVRTLFQKILPPNTPLSIEYKENNSFEVSAAIASTFIMYTKCSNIPSVNGVRNTDDCQALKDIGFIKDDMTKKYLVNLDMIKLGLDYAYDSVKRTLPDVSDADRYKTFIEMCNGVNVSIV